MPHFKGQLTIANASNWIGSDPVVSDWIELTQTEVSAFGRLTSHFHWLHMDPGRARLESTFGGTIAQGFLILNFIIYFSDQSGLRPTDSIFSLNYGLDKVRFLQPVPIGNGFRLRDHIRISEVLPRKDGRVLIKTTHDLEVEGLKGAVVYAEWLALWTPKNNH